MANELILEGILIKVMDTEQVSETFKKRTFVIETFGQYPEKVAFELIKDKVDIINLYPVGANLKVKFNVRGREWNGKFFTNLQAWFVGLMDGATMPPKAEVKAEPQAPTAEIQDSDDDDLPF